LLNGLGIPVMADDLLVLDEMRALSGPACIDLRTDAAQHLGVDSYNGVVGGRERWRLVVPPVTDAVPLRGWLFPVWGDSVEIRSVPVRDLMARLVQQRYAALAPPDPQVMLELVSLPAYELSRPARWSSLEPAVEALLEMTGDR
jgi:hypothetical protein